jgi:uncharacterized protein YcaQ
MMGRKVKIEHARRLAVARQRLSGSRQRPVTKEVIHDLVRTIGGLQLDPTLLWDERRLYEYWAHQASIVPTEDRGFMRRCRRPGPTHARRRPG